MLSRALYPVPRTLMAPSYISLAYLIDFRMIKFFTFT